MKPSFAIVGCGRVGSNLAYWLQKIGFSLTGLVVSESTPDPQTLHILENPPVSRCAAEITTAADIVLITTPDGRIADTCTAIADQNGFKADTVVLHCSGSMPSTILESAADAGIFVGSMHPLQSFAALQTGTNPFEGIVISVEGNRFAVRTARGLASSLGARVIEIRTAAKTLYHAAAVAASNFLVTLVDMALQLMQTSGMTAAEALDTLMPLVEGTLTNIQAVGCTQALTGPMARGDVKTIESHCEALSKQMPHFKPLYTALAAATIDIAARRKSLAPEIARQMREALL